MQKADFWIERLQLLAHPEGGFYRETYRSPESFDFGHEAHDGSPRNLATAIYYLLRTGERSRLHCIGSDELWFHHTGLPLEVHMFPPSGSPSSFLLGSDPEKGEVLQGCVPAGYWFGACHPNDRQEPEGFSLVSCVVAPGFDFRDFSFAKRELLLERWPEYTCLIDRLT
ncbi:MAG: cupin domain-containing protein [Chlorobi bacterium]|nr:cupin domain-containing protein [Chlorobiota bacterium]